MSSDEPSREQVLRDSDTRRGGCSRWQSVGRTQVGSGAVGSGGQGRAEAWLSWLGRGGPLHPPPESQESADSPVGRGEMRVPWMAQPESPRGCGVGHLGPGETAEAASGPAQELRASGAHTDSGRVAAAPP